jgi:hypothetical protein
MDTLTSRKFSVTSLMLVSIMFFAAGSWPAP